MGIIQSIICSFILCMERILTWTCCAAILMLFMFIIVMITIYGISVGYHYAQKELARRSMASRSLTTLPSEVPPPQMLRQPCGRRSDGKKSLSLVEIRAADQYESNEPDRMNVERMTNETSPMDMKRSLPRSTYPIWPSHLDCKIQPKTDVPHSIPYENLSRAKLRQKTRSDTRVETSSINVDRVRIRPRVVPVKSMTEELKDMDIINQQVTRTKEPHSIHNLSKAKLRQETSVQSNPMHVQRVKVGPHVIPVKRRTAEPVVVDIQQATRTEELDPDGMHDKKRFSDRLSRINAEWTRVVPTRMPVEHMVDEPNDKAAIESYHSHVKKRAKSRHNRNQGGSVERADFKQVAEESGLIDGSQAMDQVSERLHIDRVVATTTIQSIEETYTPRLLYVERPANKPDLLRLLTLNGTQTKMAKRLIVVSSTEQSFIKDRSRRRG